MVRVASAVLALMALGSLPAMAADTKHRDPDGRFVVTVPEGWATAKPKDPDIAIMMASSKAEDDKGGACYVAVRDMPTTRETAQAELDQAFGEVLTVEFWTKLFQASGVDDVKIETTGNRTQRGRTVYHVVATVGAKDKAGAALLATGRQEVHAVPGSLQFIQCVAAKNVYPQMEPQFTKVFASFEPKPNQLLVRATPQDAPSVITLTAGAAAARETKVVAQDLPNVPALSGGVGTGVTMGVGVAGSGRWEVCEGVNYTGTCRVATVGEAAQTTPVGSVRRYFGPDHVEGVAAINAATTAQLKAALDRLSHSR
jgi:hypothetical protein